MKKLEDYKDILLEKKSFAQVAIVRKNGDPHVTPLWFSVSDNDLTEGIININTATGRVKANNIKTGDKIAISISDPENPYRFLGVEGIIQNTIMGEEAETHIDELASKYLGKEKYPYRTETEKRIKYPVKITKIFGS
ncbi:MAG: pyridoxamine 5'-phosphate oxidase family protein [Candidatus Kariarchaeaceae archaeon]|jgi:PPOX class probable F420-dependent enzyme